MAGPVNTQDHVWLATDDLSDCAQNVSRAIGKSRSTTNVPLLVQGVASQTGDLAQFQNSTGTVLAKVDASGNATFASVSGAGIHSSTVTASSAIANTDTYISVAKTLVVSSTLVAGSIIRFAVLGTTTSSNADSQVFTVRAGTAGTTSDASVCTFAVTSAGSGTAIPFALEILLVVRVPGASGTAAGTLSIINSTATTGIVALSSFAIAATSTTLATTTATKLGLSYISGASTTATTFQVVTCEIQT